MKKKIALLNKLPEAVTFLTYIREVPDSILDWGTGYPELHFHGLLQSFQTNVGIVPQIRTRTHSKSLLTIHANWLLAYCLLFYVLSVTSAVPLWKC
jgi:hypothetical protein